MSAGEVYLFLLHRSTLTVFVDLLLFADETTHPYGVIVVENQTLIFGESHPVLFEHGRTFFVFPQFEEILSQKQNSLQSRLRSLDINMVLSVRISIAHYETFDQKRLLYICFCCDSHQQLADPALLKEYHLAEWVSEWAVR